MGMLFREGSMLNRLTEGLNFQAQALVLRSERQRVIASNIANADTPGYQARELDFARALRQAIGAGAGAGAGTGAAAVAATHAAHIAPRSAAEHGEQALTYARPSQTSLDSNSVDMDRERASFADNAVKYEATLRFINGSVRGMLEAMRNHNQG